MLNCANQPYDQVEFHKLLVQLAGVTATSQVLDVGCGVGRTLNEAVRIARRTVGIDNNERFLGRARQSLAAALDDGRLELATVDLNQGPLPFAEESFDSIICQNVLECIRDKPALIAACCRALKPGGVFLLSHHDFGGVMLNSADTALTRDIVVRYADSAQDWMDAADGEVGRKLPGLMGSADFAEMTTETRQLVGLSFAEGTSARAYCIDAAKTAVRSGLAEADVDRWLGDLDALDRRGAFYLAIPWVYVRARK
ncbi:methyltransferase domain-containing protein [Pelagibius sp.]|uniref:methyltransferase domain-containing protein n=1 Tax=Pelagibius sp. TaxID=1931238 RepID=UPI00261889BE|nr:methyltransferase domain-containing protein [Pelagibius sp.]